MTLSTSQPATPDLSAFSIWVEDLTCRYLARDEPTLRDISFGVQPGHRSP